MVHCSVCQTVQIWKNFFSALFCISALVMLSCRAEVLVVGCPAFKAAHLLYFH